MTNLVTTIHFFVITVILADSSSISKAEEIKEFLSEHFGWLIGIFVVVSLVVAAVAALTGNLQKIIDFYQKNLLRKKSEVSQEQLSKLRGQILIRLQSDVSIRRKNSLHNLIQIDLQLEEQRHQVGGKTLKLIPPDPENNNLINRVFRNFNRGDRTSTKLKPTQKTIEFFDRNDVRGKLLILGEPGAGKTTELLSLSKNLIQRAVEHENVPIPIIFELSSWKDNQAISDWLVEQLVDTYKGIPKRVAERWIDKQQVIPLLDGLDELGLERQNNCIDALNQFLDNSFQPGLVVCCRREEYEQAQTKLEQLNGAIYLQSLTENQIQQYLENLKRSRIWDETIVNEPDLLELVRKPLFLTMLVIAYQGRAIKNYSELFENYIENQLNNPDNQATYPPGKSPSQKQTLHYLIRLARKLEVNKKTEFLIEEIQPTWLKSKKQKTVHKIVSGLSIGSCYGIIIGLTYLLIALVKPELIYPFNRWLSYGLNERLIIWLSILGYLLLSVLTYGLIGGLIGGLIKTVKIKPVEKLNFSFKKFMNRFFVGLRIGLKIGLIGGLIGGLIYWWLSVGLSAGLISSLFYMLVGVFLGLFGGLGLWLTVGLFYGLIGGISNLKMENKNFPNQGIWNSFKNGLSVGAFYGLIVGLIVGLIGLTEDLFVCLVYGIMLGLFVGLSFGLNYGLIAVIQHFTLRFILYINGYIPWNYALFLDHAAKHRFIQRVGGRYRFMHDLLRKHFAQMPLN